jgi:hypothetical protein
MINTRIVRYTLLKFLLFIATVFSLGRPAEAVIQNAGVYITPSPASIGQTITLKNSIKSTAVESNLTVTLQIRPVVNSTVGSTVHFSQVLTGQNFALNETKQYQQTYVVPATMISGTYTYCIKVTNSAGTTTYMNVQSTSSPMIFTVNGVTASTYMRGINIMDLGIAGNTLPGVYGTNYTKPNLTSLQDLRSRGIKVIRIPFLWERIQPTLGGPLNTAYLGYLLQVLRDANTADLKVIVDMHNYGRYTPTTTSARVAYPFGHPSGPTQAQYADAWEKISAAIKADAQAYNATYAYDLMNEPHSIPHLYVPFANPYTVCSFETNTEGWTAQNPSKVTLSKETRNSQGSLKMNVIPESGSGLVYRMTLPSTIKQLSVANGGTIQFKGYVPTTTTGTIQFRVWMVDSAYTMHQSPLTTLPKGTEFTFRYTPTASWWTNYKSIIVDFIANGTDGVTPSVFYIDDITQGTISGDKTPPQVWEAYSQAAVTGIRSLNDTKLIMVEGYEFSSAARWAINHPVKWITDPQNNTMYHAHMYMDSDSSGAYALSHSAELSAAQAQGFATVGARGVARLKNFTDWTEAQNVSGFLGEFGWPNANTVGASDGAAWNADGEELLDFLDSKNMGGTMWATGTWLTPTGNILNTYQLANSSRPFLPLSQATVLEAHLN